MRIFHIFLFLLAFSLIALADDKLDWKPVSAEELSMKTPKVETDADVEAIFWEIRIKDKLYGALDKKEYIRLKIFTERGIEKFKSVEFSNDDAYEDIGVRVISPDGKITEISEKEFLLKEVAKTRYGSLKARVAPIPNLQVGSILEYQFKLETTLWNLVLLNSSVSGTVTGYRVSSTNNGYNQNIQKVYPVQKETVFVKLDSEPEKWVAFGENLNRNIQLTKDPSDSDYYYFTLENVSAFKEEPFLPPDKYIKQIVSVIKNRKGIISKDEYFAGYAGNYTWWKKWIRETLGKDADIRKTTFELTKNIDNKEEKLRLLYEFCQKEIRNWNFFYSKFSEEEKKKFQRGELYNNPLREILKRKIGSSGEIRDLFGAMAYMLGYEVRLAFGYSRKDYINTNERDKIPYMYVAGVGVKINDQWVCLEPGNPFLPFGKNPWQVEGQSLMMVDEKEFSWIPISSTPEKNLFKRTANFTLSENGELEGNIKVELNGYRSFEEKSDEIKNTKEEIEKSISKDVLERVKDATVSDMKLENYGEYNKPYTFSYRIKIPNYASKTGKRLFFQPSYFKFKVAPLFTSETRIHPIYMPTPWLENDEITFTLPKGYKYESYDANGLADPNKIGMLTMTLEKDESQNSIKFKRQFYFGRGGQTLYSTKVYSGLKELFDKFNLADTRVISLVKE
jgi:hypothetical protein